MILAAWWLFGLVMAWFWGSRLRDGWRGMPAVANIATAEWDRMPQPAPTLTVVVPARNEGEGVLSSLASLQRLEYPDYEVIAIDDRSDDNTGHLMDDFARTLGSARWLRVSHVRELPPAWMGKQHAMWLAAQEAKGEWLLFTDADVEFRPDALRRAIAYAEAERVDHLVLFPSHNLNGAGEKIFMAGFQILFALGHRPWKVSDTDSDDFMGLGPFNLIRRSAYEQIGTWEALKMEVIEDMKLGKLVKKHRLSQRCVFGPGLLPWKWGNGAMGISRNLTKNMFSLLQFRWGKSIGALLLLLAINFIPLVGAIWAPRWAKMPYCVALACIAAIHWGMGKRTQAPGWTFFFYPISTLMIALTLGRSMVHAFLNKGVVWRGTKYSLEELRKGWV